jgi:hypothetical protein
MNIPVNDVNKILSQPQVFRHEFHQSAGFHIAGFMLVFHRNYLPVLRSKYNDRRLRKLAVAEDEGVVVLK